MQSKLEKMPVPNKKQTFHYSVTSLILIIAVNFLALINPFYISYIRKGYYGETDGLAIIFLAFILSIGFIILYVFSIVKTVNIRNTDYGRKSLKIIAIDTLILAADIFLLIRWWFTVNG